MIACLFWLLLLVLLMGLLWYLLARVWPLPEPFSTVASVILVLILVLYLVWCLQVPMPWPGAGRPLP